MPRSHNLALRRAVVKPDADPVSVAVRLGISWQAALVLIAEAREAANDAAPLPEPAPPVAFTPARPRQGGGRCQGIAKMREAVPAVGSRTCQWIEGEPRARDFCGAPVREGSSYCEAHHARCYRKPTAAEKRLEKGA
ncbi:MAG: hypothetical protein IH626_05475 [Rhodospirillales bacterium]|nr:hypothetical protein [Rhodospirillales bacterium]